MNADLEAYVSGKIGTAWRMSKGQALHARYRPADVTFARMRAALDRQFDAWLDVLAAQLAEGIPPLAARIRPLLAYSDVTTALNFSHAIATADQTGKDSALKDSLPAARAFAIAQAVGHPVDAMYGHILGRAPDALGRAWWVDQLEVRGTPLSVMCRAMEREKARGAR